MEVKITLSGWADGIKKYKKIEFPLQLAMYRFIGDCDWDFDITVEGSDVRKPHHIFVRATRICSIGYGKPYRTEQTLQLHEFNFIVESFTLENVYLGASNILKGIL
jgi:hypothetical protein